MDSVKLIREGCQEILDLLLEKNEKYGNSALEPLRIFSTTDTTEQLKVRIDDKISRVKNQNLEEDEDVLLDLIGYLILLKISLKRVKNEN